MSLKSVEYDGNLAAAVALLEEGAAVDTRTEVVSDLSLSAMPCVVMFNVSSWKKRTVSPTYTVE
jgi:hypothetical protein